MNTTVVVLGASNVARGKRQLVNVAQQRFGACDLLVAAGHGRSYGCSSRVLIRELPGILHCELWPTLTATRSSEVHALITDIGNDIVFGCGNETILCWVRACIMRLRDVGAQVTLTSLPIDSLRSMRRWQFTIARQVFFPSSRLTYSQAAAQAVALDRRLQDMADELRVNKVSPRATWYGLDPIHVLHRHYRDAWSEFLGLPLAQRETQVVDVSAWSTRAIRPAHSVRWGRVCTASQPSLVLPTGTRISWF